MIKADHEALSVPPPALGALCTAHYACSSAVLELSCLGELAAQQMGATDRRNNLANDFL